MKKKMTTCKHILKFEHKNFFSNLNKRNRKTKVFLKVHQNLNVKIYQNLKMHNKDVSKSSTIILMSVVKFKKNAKLTTLLFILNLNWLPIRNTCILVLSRDTSLSRHIPLWQIWGSWVSPGSTPLWGTRSQTWGSYCYPPGSSGGGRSAWTLCMGCTHPVKVQIAFVSTGSLLF